MEVLFDCIRCTKRLLDPIFSSRKAVIILLFISAFVLYVGPTIFSWFHRKTAVSLDPATGCISELISIHNDEINSFDASVKRNDIESMKHGFLPSVGNGQLGFDISPGGSILLKNNSILSVPLKINIKVELYNKEILSNEGIVIQYVQGIVTKYKCLSRNFKSAWIRYRYLAHRIIPSLLVQEIQINNVLNENLSFRVHQPTLEGWIITNTRDILSDKRKFKVISGTIPAMNNGDKGKVIIIVLVTTLFDEIIKVPSRSSKLEYSYTVIKQSEPVKVVLSRQKILQYEEQAINQYKNIVQMDTTKLLADHMNVWKKLWNSGFEISLSKAADSVNGDQINATIYYTLSNSRAFLHEKSTSKEDKEIFLTRLAYADHCYGGYQTLQASGLWSSLETLQDVSHIVSLWLLTLDKQGCRELIKAGTDGVMQAMILSLGAMSFSDNHLEFNMRPKDLHRNYLFRRINYGIGTHLNISVVVGEDNKAVLYTALDQNDKQYYACDGGCLDPPVQLGKLLSKFPVKKTDPPTAVLYITSDKEHMASLKHALHVKEVIEAPAHEHHVIALHKHGHHWGGLPPFFWFSIFTLVIIFHLFLIKLVCNEYCVSSEKYSVRYNM